MVDEFTRENAPRFEPREVLVSSRCKHSIFNLMQALLNEGDEAIIPEPYWVSYPDMAHLAGTALLFVGTTIENGFKMRPEQLRGALGERSRLLVLRLPRHERGDRTRGQHRR